MPSLQICLVLCMHTWWCIQYLLLLNVALVNLVMMILLVTFPLVCGHWGVASFQLTTVGLMQIIKCVSKVKYSELL